MIEVVEDNPYLPVSLHDMKKFLKVEHDQLDDLIMSHIKLATRIVERMLGKSFLVKTYRFRWKQTQIPFMSHTVRLPIGPIKEMILVKNLLNQCRIRRFTVDLDFYVVIPEFLTDVEFTYKAGIAHHPHELDPEYQHLVKAVTQGLYEEQDLNNHYSMRLIQCYKSNSCASA